LHADDHSNLHGEKRGSSLPHLLGGKKNYRKKRGITPERETGEGLNWRSAKKKKNDSRHKKKKEQSFFVARKEKKAVLGGEKGGAFDPIKKWEGDSLKLGWGLSPKEGETSIPSTRKGKGPPRSRRNVCNPHSLRWSKMDGDVMASG